MNKFSIIILLVFFSLNSIASNSLVGKKWGELDQGNHYVLSQTITLSDDANTMIIELNSNLLLKERSTLGMIKVELYKFDVSDKCNDQDMTTDIELIEIIQSSGKTATVGVDLAEGCILEVFVELTDLYSTSLFH